MWKFSYCPQSPLSIRINIPKDAISPASKILIWNYNDIYMLGAGVKTLEIIYNNIVLFHNTIQRGNGSDVYLLI